MRFYLLFSACALLSCCNSSREVASAGAPAEAKAVPVVVGNDTVGYTTTIVVGKKSQVNVQIGGRNNTATAAKTDNTGRDASTGANGGHSEATTTNKTPVWALMLLGACGFALGIVAVLKFQRWRARSAPT